MDRWNSYQLDCATGRAKFTFLGHRDYVHGSSMLDVLLEMFKARYPEAVSDTAVIKSFRIIQEFSTGATAHVMPTAEVRGNPLVKDAVARLDLINDVHGVKEQWSGLLLADPDMAALGRRDDYDSRDYVARIQPLDGFDRVECANVQNRIDLIRAIIEGMLQIERRDHGVDVAITRMRWGYLSGFRLLSDAAAAQVKAFTLSTARIIDAPGQEFSIRDIALAGADIGADAQMCFFSALDVESTV